MSIIYSYPIKSTPANDDLILISDSGSDPKFQTKQIKVSSLPGGSASGVSSFNTLTGAVTITAGSNVTFTPSGQNIEISAAGGGNPPGGNANNQVQYKTDTTFGASANLTFTTNTLAVTHTVDIKGDGTNAGKLKLYCENTTTPHAITLEGPAHSGAAAYTLKLPSPAPSNQQILQSDGSGVLSWINTPSSGGGGSVDSVNTTDGTFINLTPNSATTGAVTVTADLSATGTAGNTTFLRGDNQWATPTNTTYNAMTTSTLGLGKLRYTTGSTPAAEAQSVTANRTYGITENDSGQLVVNVPWVDTNTAPVDSVSAGTSGASSGSALSVSPTTGAVKVTSNSYAGTTNVGHVPTGGSATTFLRGDGTWVTPTDTNTNIGGNNLILTNNRTLNFYSDTSDKDLTFIGGDLSGTKTLFKFDTVLNKPRLTIGDTTSTYEGTLDIKGNGSNRTGKINLYNAAGTYSYNIQVPTTFGAASNIPFVLPDTQGAASTFLQNNGSGVLTWAVPTNTTDITLTTTGSSGAATWNGTTLNIPQYSGGGGSGASLGFAPLEIYSANGATQASYIYYMVAVCDVDFTVNKCKVAVTSGTSAVYVAVYSMNYGSLQSSTLTKLGDLSIAGAIAGVNELSLVDSAFSLTAGQTICIGVSTANLLSAGTGINNTDLGVMATSGGGSALPATPDFEGLGSANKRPAIHFYAS